MERVLNKTGELEAGGLMELPVHWKLLCGAISGATAQSSKFVYFLLPLQQIINKFFLNQ